MRIKDIPLENRPLERLLEKGPETLSTAELLAIILKNGTKGNNIIDLSNLILSKYPINKLKNCSITELDSIKGIGKVKACQIKAIFEINKRINLKETNNDLKIYSPKQVYDIIKYDLEEKTQEHLIAVYLKGNKIVSKKLINIGTDDQTLISAKEIVKTGIQENAQAIIIAHNHPSDINQPSHQDKVTTRELEKSLKLLDIKLLDHLIITKDKYFSFKENNLL
ncbi:MAG: DNA repair protein RadC [archaeon]|jgi:DNA repair protein RadC|nr:DNA repair protein RadC [archaeon]MDD2477524.1 DNA repair protein RadC [Candidatus ainarchaeum sp.]MDD3084823.1 DNA repair protein RadC [Candidatus ainarchaeum sp.]MDD4221387.1 DNA repair protein RadC [Candidatus ainarchaeum sp.]MDD4662373.1 DNA repair protein RadC [Candidatus ainarchaeum sp.]